MITLSILKELENQGFGTIGTDLFSEVVTLDNKGIPNNGIWIVTRPSNVSRVNVEIQSFDIYARYANNITAYKKLEGILAWLQEAYGEVCTLPAYPPHSLTEYKNVRIFPTSSIDSVGLDENNKLVRVISFEVYYNKGE